MSAGIEWLSSNFRIKAGLFLLAVMLWFLVVTLRVYEQTVTMPLQVVGLKPEKVIVSAIPTHAEVKIQSTGRELVRMYFFSKPYLQLDISSIRHFYTFPLRVDMVVIPGGLTSIPLNIVSPDSVKIVLRTKKEVILPVSPDIRVKPEAGYTLAGEFVVTPSEVRVTGPTGQIEKVTTVLTESLEISDLKRSKEVELALILPLEYGTELSLDKVKVLIPLERIGERTLLGVVVIAQNTPPNRNILVDPATVDVVVSGGISKLAELKADKLVGWVDYLEYNPAAGGRTPVHIRQPEGIDVKSVTPPLIKMIIRRK